MIDDYDLEDFASERAAMNAHRARNRGSCLPLHLMDSDPRDEFIPVTDYLRDEDYEVALAQLVAERIALGEDPAEITDAAVTSQAIDNFLGGA